jgi:hypothetical protein
MNENRQDRPRDKSIEFFKIAMWDHSKVNRLIAITDQRYKVLLENGELVNVYLTDLYTVGIADYLNIRSQFPQVNCIVTISRWNGYTRRAKESARRSQIGLFVMVEFMGALHRKDFWNYVKTNDKGEPEHFWRSQYR